MPDDEPRIGQQAAQLLGLRLDRLDPVVDVEHLPAAIELAQDRVADEPRRRLGHPRLDRQAVLGRRLDDAEVADPGHRQVERARDRRGRQRQHVDLAAELLEPLLGGHAEALLLVDDHQAKVLEPDVLAEQTMRPDDDVDGPVGETLERRGLLLGRDEPRQQPDLERERREALAERRVVLRREDGRRHEHRDLLAVLRRLECRAQGHLGLAVADVADHEPVHRPLLLHVGLDLGGGAQLVEGLLVRERRLHLLLPGRVVVEGMALRPGPRGVEAKEVLGQVRDGLADALLGAQPLRAAELG